LASAAHAEYLYPYPNYSHRDSGVTDPSDPLNVLFGGTSSGGYFGTQWGIKSRLSSDCGWAETTIASHQYVKFQSNLGGWAIREEKDGDRYFEETKGGLLSRYHARLFRDPFATAGGSYAEKNCVTSIHHEHVEWINHVIDQDWEVCEEDILYDLVVQNPNNWYSYDAYYNAGFSKQGYYSNGYMSACTLRLP
jgi:hypothetical protein